MKRLIVPVLIGVMVLGQPHEAAARGGRKTAAALGFLGGLLVAEAYRPSRVYREEVVIERPVVREIVVERPVYRHRDVIVERPRGHYECVERRVWEPGRWVYYESACGFTRRFWEPGCYRTVRERVWVSKSRRGCRR